MPVLIIYFMSLSLVGFIYYLDLKNNISEVEENGVSSYVEIKTFDNNKYIKNSNGIWVLL